MKSIHLLCFILISNLVFAINTNISGVINSYAPVTAITTNTLTLGTIFPAHTFVCGDRVMVIQMKGASITTTNNASFGNITNINEAGNYEMATVSSISGSIITLSNNLSKSYTISGLVQLVYVPHYEDVTVTSDLTAQAWNGTTGGVLAIEVDGTLTMNANIDVSEQGFRGGGFNSGSVSPPSPLTCVFGFIENGVVGINYTYTGVNRSFAVEKGESIVSNSGHEYGKGKLASGGGGGGLESGGGGGGSNFGYGGNAGGGNFQSCNCSCTGFGEEAAGIGGLGLSSHLNNQKLFLGGGSGAGNNGNTNGYYTGGTESNPALGKNGGGIIYIKSNTLNANGNSILSQGQNGYIPVASDDNFGGSGGGAGGSVVLNVNQFTSNLSIDANGGFGSTVRVNGGGSNRRRGAGGGGGGGYVQFSLASAPAMVTTSVLGGIRGLSYNQGTVLQPSHYGTNGGNGLVNFNYSEIGSKYEPVNLVSSSTSTSDVVNSSTVVDFAESGLLVSVNSNGNNLGNTTVTATVGSNGPFTSTGCSTDEYYLPRYFEIVPTIQPASASYVSLYITDTELQDFITFTNTQSAAYKSCWGEVNSINDLMVTVVHSDNSREALIPTISYIACSDIYKLDVSVSQFSTFYIHSNKGILSGNVLPVEWLSFDAEFISKEEVELNWATGVEINNDGFYIERSYDGEIFKEIAWVNGKGNYNAKTDYRFVDKIDVYSNFSNVYYRLNQMDYNGKQEYSEIKALTLKNYNFIGEIYPNPTFSKASIDIINNTNEDCTVNLFNAIGKLVYSKKVKTTEKGLSKINIEIEYLNSGIYTCILEINGEKTVRILIKK